FEMVPCRVGEDFGAGSEVQSPSQKRRHLAAGHRIVGTEQRVVGRVAASGDAGCAQGSDVVFEEVSSGVSEDLRALGQTKGTVQEGRHLPTCHYLVDTEQVV